MRAALILSCALLATAACDPGTGPIVQDDVPTAPLTPTLAATANPDGSCKVRRLRPVRTGELLTTNCIFTGLGYAAYADVYRFRPDREFAGYDPDSQLSAFTFEVTSEFSGVVGLKENTRDEVLETGTLYAGLRLRGADPVTFSVIGTERRYQLFLLGGPGETGAYEITTTRQDDLESFRCGAVTAVVPPMTFDTRMRRGRACDVSYGTAATRENQWYVQVPPGATYTVRVDGFSGRSAPELRVIGWGGGVIAADTDALDGRTFREVTISVDPGVLDPTRRFVMISVADRRNGDYTLSVN